MIQVPKVFPRFLTEFLKKPDNRWLLGMAVETQLKILAETMELWCVLNRGVFLEFLEIW